MFRKLLNLISKKVLKSAGIKQNPLNKASLVLLIFIDIFVLINVFSGLGAVTETIYRPSESFPCFIDLQSYSQTQNNQDKDFYFVSQYINRNGFNLNQQYLGKLFGEINKDCLEYQAIASKINENSNILSIYEKIKEKENNINDLRNNINQLDSEYNSTLLETIAKQPQNQSINQSNSAQTKTQILAFEEGIKQNELDLTAFKTEILNFSESKELLLKANNKTYFNNLEKNYKDYFFWYNIDAFIAQVAFLLPLILIAYLVNLLSDTKKWRTLSLVSWNLLVVFCIPAIFKIFEFLQFGTLFQFIFSVIVPILYNLAFLGSYLLIFIIPFLGYLIILFLQKFVFKPKDKVLQRLQNQQCFECGFKLNNNEFYCPNCGTCQHKECVNCKKLKYKFSAFCQYCGVKEVR